MPHDIKYSPTLLSIIDMTYMIAVDESLEFITPEIVLDAMLYDKKFCMAVDQTILQGTNEELHDALLHCIYDTNTALPDNAQPTHSEQYIDLFTEAELKAQMAQARMVDVPMVVSAMMELPESWAANLLEAYFGNNRPELLRALIDAFDQDENDQIVADDLMDSIFGEDPLGGASATQAEGWRDFVTCINDHLSDHNPLIGREAELERTMQVLCRKDKNNPLHLGEPGVGKTSIVYGLAQRIEDGNVPDKLKGFKIYSLDMGTLLAGTQYRGDFEKRIKDVMKGIAAEGHAIVYIDEIHNIVGAGRGSDGTLDASNMLKPYLEGGDIRFIGSTTYEEYNRNLTKSKGMIRRFQPIDILEPGIDEAIGIIRALKPQYEAFHGVRYDDQALEFAVRMSAKHITDRYLPDKAIDLMDEAGAYLQMGKGNKDGRLVDQELIAQVLAHVAKVDALAIKEDDTERLDTLQSRITSKIYGQDSAVTAVVEAVQLAKAGLTDDDKPLASLLFVGPTGVGKTEVARVLASELGVELVRFDMSEYQEKHTVAKLIGSPAGYVGYDDGGLLTDAVRRSPDCVLLLDEIEKAHSDVFDILLQVMDYGTLTDNKGRKAYFRNVILIMTSNAGAQFARQASVGFASTVTTGQAMLTQVKKLFKPEFVNRLSEIVVFADMDRHMASLILDKKLRELQAKLTARNVTLKLTAKAREQLIDMGFSQKYGGREVDRVIQAQVKSRLMRQMLFGSLRHGGTATLGYAKGVFTLSCKD